MSTAKTLEGRRSATREARRILRAQVSKALKKLQRGRPTDSDIHAARKDIKKARATLKLLRAALSKTQYGNENQLLREAAHPLSAARDAKILVATLDRLLKDYASARRIGGLRHLQRRLIHDSDRARHALTTGTTGARHARKLLRKARSRAEHLSVGHHDWSRIGKGLVRVYRQGYDSFAEARAEPAVVRLHEWRKQAKYLYYQLQLLEPICPERLSWLARGLHRLSDELGDDHDLALLREQVVAHLEIFPDEASRIALLTLIDRSRTNLQRKALLLGVQLYWDEPERFESRLHRYWLRWPRDGNHPDIRRRRGVG